MSNPPATNHDNLWGLVLAGGEGKRLEDYVSQVRGSCLPKQYVNFVGTRSMLEHTYDRAARLIAPQRIFTIVSKHHMRWPEVRRQLSRRAVGTVIVQPENKDTGLGVLLPLIYLSQRCPDATVAVFPSDHYILEEERFLDHVALAASAVHHDPSRIVLLAMEAQWPESEYGYVVPAESNGYFELCGCRKAAHFVEKPDPGQARLLVAAGALWNTMIMVFKVETLWRHIDCLYPDIASRFYRFSQSIGTGAEGGKLDEIYRNLPSLNFSKDILEKIATHLPAAISVLPVFQVTWSDWGSPERLLATKKALELREKAFLPLVDRPAAARSSRPLRPSRAELAVR